MEKLILNSSCQFGLLRHLWRDPWADLRSTFNYIVPAIWSTVTKIPGINDLYEKKAYKACSSRRALETFSNDYKTPLLGLSLKSCKIRVLVNNKRLCGTGVIIIITVFLHVLVVVTQYIFFEKRSLLNELNHNLKR